eukprot:3523682-Rhodomonas_salina.3
MVSSPYLVSSPNLVYSQIQGLWGSREHLFELWGSQEHLFQHWISPALISLVSSAVGVRVPAFFASPRDLAARLETIVRRPDQDRAVRRQQIRPLSHLLEVLRDPT